LPGLRAADAGADPVETGLVEVRTLLGEDRAEEALSRLDRFDRSAQADPRVLTWREYTERRVGPSMVAGLRFDRVPRLTRPRAQIPALAGSPAGRIVDAIDGVRTVGRLRAAVADLPGLGFYRTLAQLMTHGAMAWTDG
jgi:hypothetical protein